MHENNWNWGMANRGEIDKQEFEIRRKNLM